MKRTGAIVFGVALVSAVLAHADSEDAEARRYEHMKNHASELRARAEKLRQEAHDKGQSQSAKAKELDRDADAVMDKAKGAEPSDWPPSEVSASGSSEARRVETRPSKGLKRSKPSPAEESPEPSEGAEPEE